MAMKPVDDGSFEYRHCLKKKAYGSETLAREVAENPRRLAAGGPGKLFWYKCKICPYWHLSSKQFPGRAA